MELGRCPRCSRPYTASEVVGYGVLRPRKASAGGPRMEFACPECAFLLNLVPHGEGRYAPPGQPPPASVPESDRRPPWWDREHERSGSAAATEDPPRARRRLEPDPEPEPPTWDVGGEPGPPAATEEAPMGPAEALALLGCKVTDGPEEIERAFRERSRTCHPDKVAHLDEEFQALAERKFKRLRHALDILIS